MGSNRGNQKNINSTGKNNSRTINQEQKAKQVQKAIHKPQKTKSGLPIITSSTQRLVNKIDDFKFNHAELTKKLQDSIVSNNLYRSISTSQFQSLKHREYLDRKHFKKQKSLSNLERNMQKRLQLDDEAEVRLGKMEKQVVQKKQAIGKRLLEIKQRNHHKITQIQLFQKKVLTRIKQEMQKNLEKEKKLKKQYEKIRRGNAQLSKAKQAQSKLDQEGWKSLIEEKVNLHKIMQKQMKRQNKLIQQKNPQIQKTQQPKVIAKQKQEEDKNTKQRVKLDPKQAGRQYLDFAKKRGSPTTKRSTNSRNNNLNINLKVINYDNEILQNILSNHSGYLSKKLIKNQQQKNQEEKDTDDMNLKSNTQDQNQANTMPISQQNQKYVMDYQLSHVTQPYATSDRIKQNIGQIQEGSEEQQQTIMKQTIYNI